MKNDWFLFLAVATAIAGLTYYEGEAIMQTFTFATNATYKALKPTIDMATAKYGLPPGLLDKLLYQESHYRPDIISGQTRSGVGAVGIAQFMPSTAASLGIDPLDPNQAIPGAARYLLQLYSSFHDWDLAVAAYNWGPGNVTSYLKGSKTPPSETTKYVAAITGGSFA